MCLRCVVNFSCICTTNGLLTSHGNNIAVLSGADQLQQREARDVGRRYHGTQVPAQEAQALQMPHLLAKSSERRIALPSRISNTPRNDHQVQLEYMNNNNIKETVT